MNKVAFIVPVAPKHYPHAERFYRTAREHNIEADFYFVLSYEGEEKHFPIETPNIIILPERYHGDGIISAKKWYALEKLINNYDYCICIDSEHIVVKHINILDRCKEFFDGRLLFASELLLEDAGECCQKINKICNEVWFPIEKNFNLIKDITLDHTLYFWNNHLPIYEKETTLEFFDYCRSLYPNDFIAQLRCEHFDYIIYLYYLILFKGFALANLYPHTLNIKLKSSYNERLSDMSLKEAYKCLEVVQPDMIPMSYDELTYETTRNFEKKFDCIWLIYDVRKHNYEYK